MARELPTLVVEDPLLSHGHRISLQPPSSRQLVRREIGFLIEQGTHGGVLQHIRSSRAREILHIDVSFAKLDVPTIGLADLGGFRAVNRLELLRGLLRTSTSLETAQQHIPKMQIFLNNLNTMILGRKTQLERRKTD